MFGHSPPRRRDSASCRYPSHLWLEGLDGDDPDKWCRPSRSGSALALWWIPSCKIDGAQTRQCLPNSRPNKPDLTSTFCRTLVLAQGPPREGAHRPQRKCGDCRRSSLALYLAQSHSQSHVRTLSVHSTLMLSVSPSKPSHLPYFLFFFLLWPPLPSLCATALGSAARIGG
ncbi:hypothetical protein NL676_038582 [Syzygium grande]|nr:hypothetical protein NL676_038582 [Syzygium grande]